MINVSPSFRAFPSQLLALLRFLLLEWYRSTPRVYQAQEVRGCKWLLMARDFTGRLLQ